MTTIPKTPEEYDNLASKPDHCVAVASDYYARTYAEVVRLQQGAKDSANTALRRYRRQRRNAWLILAACLLGGVVVALCFAL